MERPSLERTLQADRQLEAHLSAGRIVLGSLHDRPVRLIAGNRRLPAREPFGPVGRLMLEVFFDCLDLANDPGPDYAPIYLKKEYPYVI